MNSSSFSALLFGVLCATVSFAAEIEAPKSLQGAIIRFANRPYYPSDVTIEQYTPKGNTAHIRFQIYDDDLEINVTGTNEGIASDKNAKPAVITFTEKNGRILTGKISGFFYQVYCYKSYTETDGYELKNETIEITLPEEGTPTTHAAKAPDTLPEGTIFQIKTDGRTVTGELGKQFPTFTGSMKPFVYVAGEGEKPAKLGVFFLPNERNQNTYFAVSASDFGRDDSACVLKGKPQLPMLPLPSPYIYFTEKVSDKIFKGTFFGYLHGYTYGKNSKGVPTWKHQFREQLHSITIILP